MLVVDKASYCETVDRSGVKVAVPGESESFVCFKV